MTKCPYCAEEISDEAIKCKHCKSDLSKIKARQKKRNKKHVKLAVLAALAIATIWLWNVTIPIAIAWYVWEKINMPKRKKLALYGLALLVLIAATGVKSHINRVPMLSITEPANGYSIQSDSIIIKGTVDPSDSEITVTTNNILIDSTTATDGEFVYKAKLPHEDNTFNFTVTNGGKNVNVSIAIHRILTDGEIAEREQRKSEAEAKAAIEFKYTNDEDKMKKVIDEELGVEVLDIYYALGRLSNLKTFEYPFAAIKNPKGNGYIGYVLTSFNNKNYEALYFVPYEALNQYEKDLIHSIKAINGTAKDLTPSVEFGDRSEFDPIDVLQWLLQ